VCSSDLAMDVMRTMVKIDIARVKQAVDAPLF
jgi:hypothetical protein